MRKTLKDETYKLIKETIDNVFEHRLDGGFFVNLINNYAYYCYLDGMDDAIEGVTARDKK